MQICAQFVIYLRYSGKVSTTIPKIGCIACTSAIIEMRREQIRKRFSGIIEAKAGGVPSPQGCNDNVSFLITCDRELFLALLGLCQSLSGPCRHPPLGPRCCRYRCCVAMARFDSMCDLLATLQSRSELVSDFLSADDPESAPEHQARAIGCVPLTIVVPVFDPP